MVPKCSQRLTTAGPEEGRAMNKERPHTTIGLRKTTKDRLDRARAPGQCYDGFLCQLVDMWEKSQPKRIEIAGPAGGNRGVGVFASSTPA